MRVTLSGKGDKTGPEVALDGDYTVHAKVTANAGCHWTLSISPSNDDIIDISTDSAGDQEQTLDPYSFDLGTYQLVITSTKCASWSVSLTH
jgi:hypothetical protein